MVSVSLFNKSEYQEFGNLLIENVVDRKGRWLFPSPKFSLTGLESTKFYRIFLTFEQVGNECKYRNNEWRPTHNSKPYEKQSVQHELGTATGRQIMEYESIEFELLRISNNSISEGKRNIVFLNSMHKYNLVLKVQEVYMNENGEWKKANEKPIEFRFEETLFIAVTHYKNEKLRDLKTDLNKHAHTGKQVKRKREEECNEAKRRCVEQKSRPTVNVVQPSYTHGSNVTVLTNSGATSASNPMHRHPFPGTFSNYGNYHSYQQPYTSEAFYSKPTTAPVPHNHFGSHQTSNLQPNQFNVNNLQSYGPQSSVTVPTTFSHHYSSLSSHSTNGNQFNSQNNNTGPHHLNTFPTPPHQDNTPFPLQPVDANQMNSHYNHRTYSTNAYPTPATNNLPYNSEFNHQDPSWLHYNTSASQPQQAPQNFNQQFQYPPHN